MPTIAQPQSQDAAYIARKALAFIHLWMDWNDDHGSNPNPPKEPLLNHVAKLIVTGISGIEGDRRRYQAALSRAKWEMLMVHHWPWDPEHG